MRKKVFKNHLYLHTFLNIMYPQAFNVEKSKIQQRIMIDDVKDKLTTEDLFRHALKHYEQLIFPKSKFRRISCVMALSKTGLTKNELRECLEANI
jgi:hypothetical protein